MQITLRTATHNAYSTAKQKPCPSLRCMALHGCIVSMASNLLTAHCTMLLARTPPRAAGVIVWRSGVSGLPGRGSFAVARVRGLAAALPIEISGGIQNGLG